MLGDGTASRPSRLRGTYQHYAWILALVALNGFVQLNVPEGGDRAAFQQTELRPQLAFLPLSENLVFSAFPQVQSIRLYRLFQPRRTKFRG